MGQSWNARRFSWFRDVLSGVGAARIEAETRADAPGTLLVMTRAVWGARSKWSIDRVDDPRFRIARAPSVCERPEYLRIAQFVPELAVAALDGWL